MSDLLDKLKVRSGSKCELCSSDQNLIIYELPADTNFAQELDTSILYCQKCEDELKNPQSINKNHWHGLNESMWSEHIPVQVVTYRVLKTFENETWAQSLLEQMYFDNDILKWANKGMTSIQDESATLTKDSNGTTLNEGDSVILIKDLVVKGANFTAKRGTLVKNISLSSNPEHIEGRVNGTQIVLLTCFLKKTQ